MTNDETWRFLKNFVIVYFDFQSGVASRDAAHVVYRLRGFLLPVDQNQAGRIWDHLIAKSGELIPTGGGASRATLIQHLWKKAYRRGQHLLLGETFKLSRESHSALSLILSQASQASKSIEPKPYRQIREVLEQGRFIQIVGEPGTGKSALLKAVAQEITQNGPVFLLKDGRIHPRGWSAHAHTLKVSDDIATLLGSSRVAVFPSFSSTASTKSPIPPSN